ncbi:MAG: hypothetical protein CMJ78_11305 [Planctomycetaceae bacterium]|nr:hypothetical protein [Planctomycetaceae bacterium]
MTSVVISVDSSDEGEVVSNVDTLTFTPNNWDQVQTVQVTGIDDDVSDGNQNTAVVLSIVDAILTARVAFQLDSGFAADPLIDPTLLSDIDGSGTLSIIDAIALARKAFGFTEPMIPDPPAQNAGTAERPSIATDTLTELSQPVASNVSAGVQIASPSRTQRSVDSESPRLLSVDVSSSSKISDEDDQTGEVDELFSDDIDLGELTLLQL